MMAAVIFMVLEKSQIGADHINSILGIKSVTHEIFLQAKLLGYPKEG